MEKILTMGRWPTLGELIEYYSRDDICAVIYYQSKRWKILMGLRDNESPFEPTSESGTREEIVRTLREVAKEVKETERLWRYPTMHIKNDRGEAANPRYNFMVETDPVGWREAFFDIAKVADVLDAHDVFYQIKYSGNQSLHLIIPAESLPKTFRGKSINQQFVSIQNRLLSYLPIPENIDISRGLRLAYSTHPFAGLVSLPLRRRELPNFHPFMANIHTVAVDFDWFEVPADAAQRNEEFLQTVFDSEEKNVTVSLPRQIATTLGQIGDSAAVPALIQTLSDGDNNIRGQVVWALGQIGDAAALDALVEVLNNDEVPKVRQHAVVALGQIGTPVAVPVLREALNDEHKYVRFHADRVLKQISSQEAAEGEQKGAKQR